MITILRQHPRFLLACFFASFFAGIGQTYLLALFNKDVAIKAGITMTEMSVLYSVATLFSALALPYIGRLIDRFSMKVLLMSMAICLSISFYLLGNVNNMISLFLVYVVIRTIGQSAFPMTIGANIAKKFGKFRGKALSLSSLGRSMAEGFLPGIVSLMLVTYGLTYTTDFISLFYIVLLLPILAIFLRKEEMGKGNFYADKETIADEVKSNVVASLLRKKIAIISLANLTMPYVLTGFFFHNTLFIEDKNWDLLVWGKAFSLYAVCSIVTNFAAGYMIDRFSARNILPFILLPLMFGLIILRYSTDELGCYLFLAFAGISVGFNASVRDSFFAEVYGSKFLGSIRGIDSSIIVFATAVAPTIFAFLFNYLTVDRIIEISIAHTLVGSIMFALISFHYEKRKKS
jgi:MFS family permease